MKRDLTELNKLEDYLKENGIEYQREDMDNFYSREEWRDLVDKYGAYAEPMDLHQIVVFADGRRSWDVICHRGGRGCEKGLLEGLGDLFDRPVEGFLTAADVIKKIEDDQIVVIKPCAKCGGAPVLYDTKCGDKTVPAIKCQRCGRMFRQTFWDRGRLIEAWNTYDRKEEAK